MVESWQRNSSVLTSSSEQRVVVVDGNRCRSVQILVILVLIARLGLQCGFLDSFAER